MPNIQINLTNVTKQNRKEKFAKVVEALAGKLHIPYLLKAKHAHGEELISVLDSIIAKYARKLKKMQYNTVQGLVRYLGITIQKAKDADILVIKGKAVFNPNTGLPMTRGEWKRVQSSIDTFLGEKAGEYGYQMASEATTTGILNELLEKQGKDIEKMNYDQLGPSISNDLEGYLKEKDLSMKDFRVSLINTERTSSYITDMAEKTRQGIKHTIEQSAAETWSKSRLGQELFDKYGELNKNWSRLAITETNNAFNSGYLDRVVEQEDEGAAIFFIGRSQSTACPICLRDINGVIARYVDKARSNDDETRKNSPATKLIWEGKTSVGKTAKDSYFVISRHCNCRCRLVRWFPE